MNFAKVLKVTCGMVQLAACSSFIITAIIRYSSWSQKFRSWLYWLCMSIYMAAASHSHWTAEILQQRADMLCCYEVTHLWTWFIRWICSSSGVNRTETIMLNLDSGSRVKYIFNYNLVNNKLKVILTKSQALHFVS